MRNNIGFDNNFPDFEQFTASFNKDDSTSFNNDSNFNDNNSTANNFNASNPFGNIDIATILKAKQIMENMNNSKNSPRANLLLALKPYLKPSRKNKVDEYIQLFSLGELAQNLKPTGGENSK